MGLPDPSELFDLKGRVAVVTGASAGLGQEFARALAGAGARVVLAARRLDRLEALADELCAGGAEARAVQCDVAREGEVRALVEETRAHFGPADILVNNAGITEIVPAEEESEAVFRRVLDVNLHGVFACCQAFGHDMLEMRRGAIVNVASILGMVGVGQIPQASYAASKGAVISLTRELAAQWARRGVRVNAIAPGWFESEMTGEMFGDDRSLKWMHSRTPMGRGGHSGEFAGALLYLVSDASSFVTGQTLAVDGGWTIV
jgi:NAD(P)-dependent dehydrogenase (short-subunit alcohol dehydrogenase family)